ncbi:MAG: hypothetical protein N2Z63_01385 [Thiobacillaceae bacterium]|nr:hypothetical protein [Thiobacillaceae bacterium]MDW8322640.1 hypothetical protein [Burkholderiales bacterium]
MTPAADTVKRREIVFHPTPPAQIERAHALLTALPRLVVQRSGERALTVHYDLNDHCLEALEGWLTAQGFHLEVSLLLKLKRALIYHVERVQRENLREPELSTKNYKPHVEVWSRRPHGDHDDTPQEWRQYK